MEITLENILELISRVAYVPDLKADTELIESGIIDSFDMISLISEFDEEFELEIEVADIDIENFKDANCMLETLLKIKERNE